MRLQTSVNFTGKFITHLEIVFSYKTVILLYHFNSLYVF